MPFYRAGRSEPERRMAIVRAELRKNVRVVIMALCARGYSRPEVFGIGREFLFFFLGTRAAELLIDRHEGEFDALLMLR